MLSGLFRIAAALHFLGIHHPSHVRRLELTALGALAAAVYAVPLMVASDGQTVGKRLLRIRVVRASGRRMSVVVASAREVFAKALGFGFALLDVALPVEVSLFVLLVDYLWPIWDRENRALHDHLAGTRVIRQPRPEPNVHFPAL